MASDEGERRLAAILSADVAGYSKLMGDDERATVRTLTDYRDVFRDHIERHHGRVVDTPGDNLMAEFASPVEAVEAAADIQRELARRNRQLAEHRRMDFRIGINLGDVLVRDGALFGDGVNIAARLEALAEAGGICISGTVFDHVKTKVELSFDFFGEQEVKNIAEPVRAYRVALEAGAVTAPTAARHWKRPAIAAAAVLAFVSIGLLVWQKTGPGPEAPAPVIATTDDPLLALLTGPSIAVLPFENLSEDSADDYFAAGLAGDIAVQLSYVQDLRIIGRSSTQKYQGTATDPRQIAKELGVQFVLVGSVRRSTKTIRVTAELIDGGDGSQIWAETFDRELTSGDLFSAQDEITRHVVNTISDAGGIIPRKLLKATADRGDVSLSSYECVLLTYEFFIAMTQDLHSRARDCLEETVKRDPDYGDAWGSLASVYALEAVMGFNTLPKSFERSLEAGLEGVRVNDKSQTAWKGLAAAHYYNHQLDKFSLAADAAVAINPNDVSTIAAIGYFYGTWGLYDKSIPLLKKALALSPNDVWWFWVPFWMQAYENEDYELALEYANKHGYAGPFTYVYFTSTYGQLNQVENARTSLDKLLQSKPTIATTIRKDCRFWNYPEPVIAKIVDGLRKAGLDVPDEPATTD